MKTEQKHVGVSVRLILLNDDKILLTKSKGSNFYFLPGGGLEFGEAIEEAIRRELQEELGAEPTRYSFVGINETKFVENEILHHGIDLVFEVGVKSLNVASKEDHIDFHFKDINELPDIKLLPKSLKNNVIQWLDDKKTFWGG